MADPGHPPLTTEQIGLLSDRVEAWAKEHPKPDRPVLAFAGSNAMVTPRELADAIRKPTEEGERFLYAVRFVLEVLPFEAYLDTFRLYQHDSGARLVGAD